MRLQEAFWIAVILLSPLSFAADGPQAFLTEYVLADYNWDGSLKAAPQRYGFVEALVPNPADVLQYVRLNLSSTGDSDLSSNVSYNSVAYSPSGGRTLMYVDTPTIQDTQYNITNADSAPAINVSMSYSNYEGGVDAYSSGNIRPRTYGGPVQTNRLNFSFVFRNPSSTRDLNGTLFNITFNTSGIDRVSITTLPTASSGTVSRVDTDGDTVFDTIVWNGSFTRGISVNISFDGNLTEGTNYAVGTDDINLNGINPSIGVWTTWSNTTISSLSGTQGSYLSAIYFSRLFARGSSRAGIDMALEPYEDQSWRVRGFFENLANATYGLNYTISSWSLYSINASSGAPYPGANYSSSSDPSWADVTQSPSSTRLYTKWFDSGLNNIKPYFASSFEWEVNWDSSAPKTYFSQVNSTLDMRTLYQIDLSTSKAIAGIILPFTENNSVTVTDQTRHIGSSNISAYFININSIVPRQSLQGTTRLWKVNTSSINVTLYNSSGFFELKQDGTLVNVSVRNPTASEDGLVNLTIYNITRANFSDNSQIGHYLRSSLDERIQLRFDVLSPDDIVTGETFNFTGNSSMLTLSGTPIMEVVPVQNITAAWKRLVGYKDMIARDPNNPTLVNVSIRLDVMDKVGTGISGIKFMDYIPNGTSWDPIAMNASINLSFFNGTAWYSWAYGVDYNITDMGWTTLADGSAVHAYEFVNISGSGWTLFDNQSLWIQYAMNITQPGVYRLPVIIAAFDPDTGASLGTSSIGVTKVYVPPTFLPAVVSEGELLLAKSVIVGKPASWMKQIEAYNPNARPLRVSFSTGVFMDSMNAVVEYTTPEGERRSESVAYSTSGGKRYLAWESTLAALESRTYTLRILTPPVIEVERRIAELSQISEKLVKVSIEVFLKNLAEEDYANVRLFMPVDDERIFSARDDSFVPIGHSSAGNGSSILTIPYVKAKQAFSLLLQYRESYPVVVITTDKANYEAGNPVGMSILVINGGESVDHPYVETEIYSPELDLMYSSVQGSKPLAPVERAELKELFLIPSAAPTGNYLVSARFREDFATITQGTGRFYVLGSSGPDFMLLGYLLILVFTVLVLYSSLRRVREIRESKSAKPARF